MLCRVTETACVHAVVKCVDQSSGENVCTRLSRWHEGLSRLAFGVTVLVHFTGSLPANRSVCGEPGPKVWPEMRRHIYGFAEFLPGGFIFEL